MIRFSFAVVISFCLKKNRLNVLYLQYKDIGYPQDHKIKRFVMEKLKLQPEETL